MDLVEKAVAKLESSGFIVESLTKTGFKKDLGRYVTLSAKPSKYSDDVFFNVKITKWDTEDLKSAREYLEKMRKHDEKNFEAYHLGILLDGYSFTIPIADKDKANRVIKNRVIRFCSDAIDAIGGSRFDNGKYDIEKIYGHLNKYNEDFNEEDDKKNIIRFDEVYAKNYLLNDLSGFVTKNGNYLDDDKWNWAEQYLLYSHLSDIRIIVSGLFKIINNGLGIDFLNMIDKWGVGGTGDTLKNLKVGMRVNLPSSLFGYGRYDRDMWSVMIEEIHEKDILVTNHHNSGYTRVPYSVVKKYNPELFK